MQQARRGAVSAKEAKARCAIMASDRQRQRPGRPPADQHSDASRGRADARRDAALLHGRDKIGAGYISVGGLDLFLEENLTYADRLSRGGVPVELHMYRRAYHGFYRATNARVTRQAEQDTREALRRFLHG
jgi:acetyl esterase/lipase